MSQPTKQSPVRALVNSAKTHKTKILVITNIVTFTYAVVATKYVGVHNEFLRENGLMEQFANLTPEA